MKTFVLGDVHGCYKALLQVFERSKFNYNNDRLICLGDVVDGWPEVYECVEELLKVKNLVYVLGNHDVWGLTWGMNGAAPEIWTSQGGDSTLESYGKHGGKMPASHVKLFSDAPAKYVENNRLFVHGGVDLSLPLNDNDSNTLTWNRGLVHTAVKKGHNRPDYKLTKFEAVFVGHTPTQNYKTFKPLHCCEVWDLDTGAGWSGRLTIMDVETKEYWQSDLVPTLYSGVVGRSMIGYATMS